MTSSLLFPELAPMPGFDFPHPLAEKYRPARIAEFAGLASVKTELAGFVSRPTNRGFVFCGPAGTGKTSMAMAMATELHGFMHHIPAGRCTVDAVAAVAFSCRYYPPLQYQRHVVIVDEADAMSYAAQLALLSYLDGTDTIDRVVWIFTANATDKLHERFLSRCRILPFSTYAIQAEAASLLERVWESESAPNQPRPNFPRLIKESLGNVRAALSTLESKLATA
jgi:replication-associated recombination protein RarA